MVEKAGRDSVLDKAFERAGSEGMRSFLEKLFMHDEALERRFVMRFGDSADVEAAKEALGNELDRLTYRYGGFIEWDCADSYEFDYERAVEGSVRAFIERGEPGAAFPLLEVAVSRFLTVQSNSDTFPGGILDLCCGLWREALGSVPGGDLPQRFAELRELACDVEGLCGDYSDFVAEQIREMLVDCFADDPGTAHLVIELADSELPSAEEAAQGNYLISGTMVSARIRAMCAAGERADAVMAYAGPYLGDEQVCMIVAGALAGLGEVGRACTLLEERVREDGRLSEGSRGRGATAQLLGLYRSAGRADDELRFLGELLSSGRAGYPLPSAAELYRRYEELWRGGDWAGERERLFASVRSDRILCELLAEEGLVERLYEKRVAMGAGPGPYEGLLLEDHADYVVRCLVDDAVESFNRASMRSHYSAAARTLAHVRELPGGGDVACEVADWAYSKWPRRSALRDEMHAAGF